MQMTGDVESLSRPS